MDSFELAERHYLHEADRYGALSQSVSLPLALITGLITALISMVSQIQSSRWAEVALVALCMGAALSLIIAIVNLIRASVRYRYAHPATIAAQLSWRDDFVSRGASRFKAEEELRQMMEREYAECAHVNATNNDKKAGYLEDTRICIIVAVCLLGIAAVPYLIVKSEQQDANVQHAVLNGRLEKPR
ncbi:MAG TPA: hypothetical protein VGC56_08585 [Allosphingosinicella sp.]|jgi:hypothetical protein